MVIGLSGQSSLDKVAGPVGEALIMTGIGLAVAIPAAIAYNSFARATCNTLTQLNSFAYDVHNFLATGIKGSPLCGDARATSDKVITLARASGVGASAGAAAAGAL
jgi:biopolymer transport protein ExbB